VKPWRYRVDARYEGAALLYATSRYRQRTQAMNTARREQKEAEEVGYAVRITVYRDEETEAVMQTGEKG
jgi:hypothetical protein